MRQIRYMVRKAMRKGIRAGVRLMGGRPAPISLHAIHRAIQGRRRKRTWK